MRINPMFLRIKKDDLLNRKEKNHIFYSVTLSIMFYFTIGVLLSTYNLTFAGIMRMLQ